MPASIDIGVVKFIDDPTMMRISSILIRDPNSTVPKTDIDSAIMNSLLYIFVSTMSFQSSIEIFTIPLPALTSATFARGIKSGSKMEGSLSISKSLNSIVFAYSLLDLP